MPAVRPVAILLFCLGLITACSAPIRTEHEPGTDFDRYQQFAWQAPEREAGGDPERDNPLLDSRVATALRAVLTQRGYEEASTAAEADFIVTYHVIKREQRPQSGSSVSVGMGSGGVGAGVTLGSSRARQQRLLLIDVLDADNGELVWRGWEDSDEQQHRLEPPQLRALFERIFVKFPPQRS